MSDGDILFGGAGRSSGTLDGERAWFSEFDFSSAAKELVAFFSRLKGGLVLFLSDTALCTFVLYKTREAVSPTYGNKPTFLLLD